MSEDRSFYVYVLFRPDGMPCYVGKGKRDRWNDHRRLGARHKNKHLARIIAKAGGDLPRVKVRSGLTNPEACAIEVAFIAAIGREPSGPLVNLTDGGEGSVGSKQPIEAVSAMRARLKGRVFSASHRQRLAEARRGRKLTPEQLRKLDEGRRASKTGKIRTKLGQVMARWFKASPVFVSPNASWGVGSSAGLC